MKELTEYELIVIAEGSSDQEADKAMKELREGETLTTCGVLTLITQLLS